MFNEKTTDLNADTSPRRLGKMPDYWSPFLGKIGGFDKVKGACHGEKNN
ncbi:hypothetical protein KKA03_02000 [archaeon]|nr:hypothetical protein [archaeon]